MTVPQRRHPWLPVTAVPVVNGAVRPLLSTVDSLRSAWQEAVDLAVPQEREAAQRRRLRRHAVETGIIERLYDLDWGTTEMLVAEGLGAEVASRAGGVSAEALDIIRAQYDALDYLATLAGGGQDITVFVVRELHQIITRNQLAYEARDHLNRVVQRQLRHGEWKQHANHVRRPDGSIPEYTPPDHVQSEMERLVAFYHDSADAHPLVRSAWLHHRFIQIHPFEDGNGRVARALTLLVLLRHHYAPLVVDRRERESYIAALDAANDGDLSELVRLFGRLEIVALQATLTQPVIRRPDEYDAAAVVQSYTRRLRDLQNAGAADKRIAAERLAGEMHAGVVGYLDGQAKSLEESLQEVDPSARVRIAEARPPDERVRWWRRQIIAAANSIDFYTNLADGAWWVRLQMEALGERLRYLAVIQKAGHGETGVLVLSVYAELVRPESDEMQTAVEPEPALDLSPTDSVTLAYTDRFADRYAEAEELLRTTLRRSTERFVGRLG
jgi:Fic family protein